MSPVQRSSEIFLPIETVASYVLTNFKIDILHVHEAWTHGRPFVRPLPLCAPDSHQQVIMESVSKMAQVKVSIFEVEYSINPQWTLLDLSDWWRKNGHHNLHPEQRITDWKIQIYQGVAKCFYSSTRNTWISWSKGRKQVRLEVF